MPTPGWQNSDRRSRLPKEWHKLRSQTFKRDGGRCTARLEDRSRCPAVATDCDHIVPGDDHRLENLTSLCGNHHAAKSAREGGAAYKAKRRAIERKLRRTEKHPGLL